jgi:predicted DCC family thiol-disulfide oxidoreductase YuxK
MHYVIYDGNCNLCVNWVKLLEQLDQGQRFRYVPMQAESTLADWGITAADCEQGMIVLEAAQPERRWQGSAAAEKIGALLPGGEVLVGAYRSLPGLKAAGDSLYGYVRDHRYGLFGRRDRVYTPQYPGCEGDRCGGFE